MRRLLLSRVVDAALQNVNGHGYILMYQRLTGDQAAEAAAAVDAESD